MTHKVVAANVPSVVDLTRQLVQIPSVNPMGMAMADGCGKKIFFERRVTDFLEGLFAAAHISTERVEAMPASENHPPRDNLIALISSHDAAATVLLEVHQDTVPVNGMTIDPFAASLSDGRIWGRGACDVKGGMAAIITAALEMSKLPESERPNIALAFTVNEEHGFSGAKRLLSDWENGMSRLLPAPPDLIVVTEPTELDVVVAHKGVIRWRCRTIGRAAHSSDPTQGHNAIYDMARIVQRLEFYANHIVADLAVHPLVGRPTLSVGTIQGGLSVNTVPDRCEIHIDRRVCPGEDHAHARQHVIDDLTTHCRDVELIHDPADITSAGLDNTHNGPLSERIVDAARADGHSPQILGVQYGTDAAILASTGIPTVVFGPGSIRQAHTHDEWVDVTQLSAAVAVLTKLVRSLATKS